MQLGRVGLRRQHPLGQRDLRALLVGVELAGNHVGEQDRLGRLGRRTMPRFALAVLVVLIVLVVVVVLVGAEALHFLLAAGPRGRLFLFQLFEGGRVAGAGNRWIHGSGLDCLGRIVGGAFVIGWHGRRVRRCLEGLCGFGGGRGGGKELRLLEAQVRLDTAGIGGERLEHG